jgi:methyltransferase (TIGR00027 family)
MEYKVPNTTAELCAAIRASHYIHGDRPLIFEDSAAIELINSDLCKICMEGNKLTRSGGASIVIGRARYTEDLLESAINSGIKQYVILGAGLDTFALRRPDLAGKVYVYEVDHPKTQQWKRELLAKLDRAVPSDWEFIPADLENETVTAALDRSSFKSD